MLLKIIDIMIDRLTKARNHFEDKHTKEDFAWMDQLADAYKEWGY